MHEIERLYRERYGTFLRVAVAIVRDERIAEEAVNDAFVRALRSRSTFDGRGSLDGWVWRIVVNEARRAAGQRRSVLVADVPESATEDTPAIDAALIGELPERQRLVLFLRYYADLDYAGIAAALEISPGTVAATLHAAHEAVRRALMEVTR